VVAMSPIVYAMAKKAADATKRPAWLGPKFKTAVERNEAVRSLIDGTLAAAVQAKRDGAPKPLDPSGGLITRLSGPLSAESPQAAAPAELAFVLSAFCLAEGRLLDLTRTGPDVTDRGRLSGDRAVSEHLARELAKYNIPSTQGVLQSSTFRSGYEAAQARGTAQQRFLVWLEESERQLDDVALLFDALAREFAEAERAYRPLPELATDAFTFAATRRLIDALLAKPSAGAYQQYLVAALTAQEYASIHPAWRVTTKSVGASDASARSAGDVEVRHGLRLVHAMEVSDNHWDSKVGQAATTARRTRTTQVTVVAPAADLTGDALANKVIIEQVPPNVDVAVVNLTSYLDVVASRLTPGSRAAAIRQVHGHLVTWGRTRPDLVDHLVDSIEALGLVSGGLPSEAAADVAESLERLRTQAAQSDLPWVEISTEDLGRVLTWLDGEGGDAESD
jgi:hypothetical protein